MDWKCLERSFVVFRPAERTMPTTLPAAGSAAFQELSRKDPFIVLDVVIKPFDELGLRLRHRRSLANGPSSQNYAVGP